MYITRPLQAPSPPPSPPPPRPTDFTAGRPGEKLKGIVGSCAATCSAGDWRGRISPRCCASRTPLNRRGISRANAQQGGHPAVGVSIPKSIGNIGIGAGQQSVIDFFLVSVPLLVCKVALMENESAQSHIETRPRKHPSKT